MSVKPLSRKNVYSPYFMMVEDINYLPNAHRETEIVIIIEGEVRVTVEGESFLCTPGDVIFIHAFDIHAYSTCKHSVIVGCAFRQEYSKEVEDHIQKHFPSSLIYSNSKNVENVLDFARWVIKNKDVNSDIQRLANLLFIFGYIEKEHITYIKKEGYPRIVVDVLQYFDENIEKDLSLDQICRDLAVSKYYLSHLFKQVIGTPMMQYFVKLKLAGAKRILSETDQPVQAISASLGFGSVRTFNRLFIKYFDVTPSDFRLQHDKKASLEINSFTKSNK